MASKPMDPKDAVDDEKVEATKTRNQDGDVVKDESDTNAPVVDHGDPEGENPKSQAALDSDDKRAVDKADEYRARGVGQDGGSDVPVQMLPDADKK